MTGLACVMTPHMHLSVGLFRHVPENEQESSRGFACHSLQPSGPSVLRLELCLAPWPPGLPT